MTIECHSSSKFVSDENKQIDRSFGYILLASYYQLEVETIQHYIKVAYYQFVWLVCCGMWVWFCDLSRAGIHD